MKKILTVLLSILFTCCLFVNVKANNVKVIDEANLLSDKEEEIISSLIDKYIKYTNYDMVVYLANKRDDYFKNPNDAITRLADDTFDEKGYGIGKDKDGIILCIDVYYRDYTITTHGKSCIDTYSIKALKSIYEKVTPCYMDNRVYEGTLEFIKGATYVFDNYEEFHENKFAKATKPSLIGSALISLVSFFILSSKLKSKHAKTTAEQYMKNAKFNVLRNGEIYLYTTITEINGDNKDSPTHVSKSGEVHGGGGSHKI